MDSFSSVNYIFTKVKSSIFEPNSTIINSRTVEISNEISLKARILEAKRFFKFYTAKHKKPTETNKTVNLSYSLIKGLFKFCFK